MFIRFDIIPERDRQTDGHSDHPMGSRDHPNGVVKCWRGIKDAIFDIVCTIEFAILIIFNDPLLRYQGMALFDAKHPKRYEIQSYLQ